MSSLNRPAEYGSGSRQNWLKVLQIQRPGGVAKRLLVLTARGDGGTPHGLCSAKGPPLADSFNSHEDPPRHPRLGKKLVCQIWKGSL